MDDYTLLEKLGQGGMGVVYRALQRKLKREVALKVLPATAVRDEELRQRFHREFRVISRVSHPNIVRVFDWGEHDGQLFYAMELVRGPDLAASAPMPFAAAAPLFEQAADALACLHDNGIWHRDVKPQNLVVEPGGRLVLVDFGLVTSRDATLLTEAGAVVGTLRFMAPEVVRGEPSQGAADVYALALAAQEVLTGRPAVHAPDAATLLERIARAEVEPLALPEVPAWFVALQRRALAVDPAQRPGARAYRDALREGMLSTLTPRAGSGAQPTLPLRAAVTPLRVPLAAHSGARTGRTRRGPGLVAVALGLVAAALGLAVLAAAYRARGPERPGRAAGAAVRAVAPSPAARGASVAPGAAPRATAALSDEERAGRVARTLAVWPTERSVLIDFDVPGPDTVIVELGGWASRSVQITRVSDAREGFVQLSIDALPSDTDHFVRVRRATGAVLLDDYRFKTLPERHARAVGETLSVMRARPSDAGELAAFFHDFPDPRAVPALMPVVSVDRPDGLYGYAKIAMVARVMRNAVLARALFRQLPRIEDSTLRREVNYAAVWGRVPEAVTSALRQATTTTSWGDVDTAARAAELTGGAAACDTLAGAIDRMPQCARFGVELPRIDRPCALEHARRWLDAPSDDLHHSAALYALMECADDRAIDLLAGDPRRGPPPPVASEGLAVSRFADLAGWNPQPSPADALAVIDRPRARLALARALMVEPLDPGLVLAAARGGDATLLPMLARALSRPGTPPALRRELVAAIGSVGGPSARPLLQRALADPDAEVAAVAAWGLSRPAAPPTQGTVNVAVPAGVTAVRTGITLSAGQSVEISVSGTWGRAGGEACRADSTCEVAPGLPPLGLTALIGTTRWRVLRRPARLLVPKDGELVLSPWQQRPGAAALLARPPLVGQAYVVIAR